ncbi:hypothetical protein B4U79_19153, partial [Dinothrombium tinctorium]
DNQLIIMENLIINNLNDIIDLFFVNLPNKSYISSKLKIEWSSQLKERINDAIKTLYIDNRDSESEIVAENLNLGNETNINNDLSMPLENDDNKIEQNTQSTQCDPSTSFKENKNSLKEQLETINSNISNIINRLDKLENLNGHSASHSNQRKNDKAYYAVNQKHQPKEVFINRRFGPQRNKNYTSQNLIFRNNSKFSNSDYYKSFLPQQPKYFFYPAYNQNNPYNNQTNYNTNKFRRNQNFNDNRFLYKNQHLKSFNKNKLLVFNNYIRIFDYDILLGVETWFKDDVLNKNICENYMIFRKDRKYRIGGGVVIAHKNHLKSKVVSLPNEIENVEAILVELFLSDKVILIGAIYIPHFNLTCLNYLKNFIHNIYDKYDDIVIYGDFNVDISKNSKFTTDLLDLFYCYGFMQA